MPDPAAELYYRTEGRDTSWYELSEEQRAHWRERYERARRAAKRMLKRLRKEGRGPR